MGNINSNEISGLLTLILQSLEALQIVLTAEPVEKRDRISGNRHLERGYALRLLDSTPDDEFQRMFRMTRSAFDALLAKVEPFMPIRNERMARVSSGSMISNKTKLCCTLRWLAGGSYIDICWGWGVTQSSFFAEHGVLWPTMEAIDSAFQIGLPLNNPEELKKTSDEFSAYSHGFMKGCVMAIDGWVARTRKPHVTEVESITSYRNRHGCWGLVVMAGCDARCRFNMFSVISSGSTNDALAWEMSAMKDIIENQNRLPQEFYAIGDEAFTTTDQLLTPYGGHGLDPWQDSFNYHLSAMRQCIERAFGLLTNRWGILWRPLKCAMNRWPLVLSVCAKLHNYCLDQNVPPVQHRFYDDVQEGDACEVVLNAEPAPQGSTRRVGGAGLRRQRFTAELKEAGQRRPAHAMINSRMAMSAGQV